MPDAPADPFTPEISAAVTAHMNGDHVEDNLLIARSLGGQPTATAAVMTGVGPAGAAFDATVDGTTVPVVVPWAVEVADRGTIRVEVVRMYHDACAALGVEPRQAGEH
jgi:putative heme iron utilization protein